MFTSAGLRAANADTRSKLYARMRAAAGAQAGRGGGGGGLVGARAGRSKLHAVGLLTCWCDARLPRLARTV